MRRRHGRSGLPAICIAASLLLLAAPAHGQLPQTSPEDDLAGQFAAAEAVFSSADQPDSIVLFDALIQRLEALVDPGRPEVPAMLLRSLSYRAQAKHNLGDEATAIADLGKMLAVDPAADVDRDLVSPKFTELFDTLRAETVAHLALLVSPADATLRVDGVVVDWSASTVATLAGNHAISIERLGFSAHQVEIEVEAGAVFPVEVTLERMTAVVSFVFSPVEAEVRLDGRRARLVPGLPGASGPTASDYFSVAGLNVGEHELEIQCDGYRPRTRAFRIEEMADYELGAIDLERASGTIALQHLPVDAQVEIDGVRAEVQPSGDGEGRIDIAPGAHTIEIDAGSRGVFSASVDVFDREVSAVAVRPRPSIAFLGVLGADELGRAAVTAAASDALGGDPEWLWMDRAETGAAVLTAQDLHSDTMRLAESAAERIVAAREGIADAVTASAYILAVLDDDLMATRVDVWTWAAPPGPAAVQRMSFGLDAPSFAEDLRDAFGVDFARRRPYLGAQFVDSAAGEHPLVIALREGSPAAATLRVGDEIAALDGTDLRTVADLEEAVAAFGPGQVDLRVRRAGDELTVQVTMTDSAEVVLPGADDVPYGLMWAAAEAHPYLAENPAVEWVLRLDQAAVLLHAREWEAAVRHLRAIQAPARSGLGQGMVEYWVGLALLQLGPSYTDRARQSFERAAAIEGATLGHDDGPLIRPLALALLAALAE